MREITIVGAAVTDQALLLDAECGGLQTEVTCKSIKGSSGFRPPQDSSWKETLKREILDDVKVQISGLTQELKPLLQPTVAEPHPSTATQERKSTRGPDEPVG